MSVVRHVIAILVLPFTMTVIVPSMLLRSQQGVVYSDSLVLGARGLVGGMVIAAGLALFAWCVSLFALVGRGTLAPWDPTQALVGVGPYRYVRNPMITGVALVLVGEAVVFRSISLVAWAAIFVTINHMYFVFVEEPVLAARFGEPYRRYKAAVPRWIPRRVVEHRGEPRSEQHRVEPRSEQHRVEPRSKQ